MPINLNNCDYTDLPYYGNRIEPIRTDGVVTWSSSSSGIGSRLWNNINTAVPTAVSQPYYYTEDTPIFESSNIAPEVNCELDVDKITELEEAKKIIEMYKNRYILGKRELAEKGFLHLTKGYKKTEEILENWT